MKITQFCKEATMLFWIGLLGVLEFCLPVLVILVCTIVIFAAITWPIYICPIGFIVICFIVGIAETEGDLDAYRRKNQK